MNNRRKQTIKSFLEKYGTWDVYLAYRRRIPWKYSISLESIIFYLRSNKK